MRDKRVVRTFFEDGKLWPSYELDTGEIMRVRRVDDEYFAYYTDAEWKRRESDRIKEIERKHLWTKHCLEALFGIK